MVIVMPPLLLPPLGGFIAPGPVATAAPPSRLGALAGERFPVPFVPGVAPEGFSLVVGFGVPLLPHAANVAIVHDAQKLHRIIMSASALRRQAPVQ